MRKALLLIYFIFYTALSTVFAQGNYPIYVTPSLSPPYSLNLSDYSKFGSQQLMVTIHANDLNINNLPVKLRISIETVGVTIENPPTIITTPIYINGGETNILFGKDLEDYFNINNLIFRGYSKDSYNRTGQLPEGFYKFTVEVLHYNTNRLISNQGSISTWIALGKPPVLKLPQNNAQMGQIRGIPLSFSWLSSNVGSPVSANTIQYKFEMWEMQVPGINPNVIAATTPVFHENTTYNTVYTLYPNTLLLTPGMQYAWRITASDVSGFVPFEQNGHSEIRTFVYKAACNSITNLTSSYKSRNGYFSWDSEENHTSFNVEMRNPKTNWMSNSEMYENKAEFFDLDQGATYEMRVQAVCDGDPDSKSDFSGWESLTIPVPEPLDTADCPDCACDDDIPAVELQNFELRNDLQPGDTIINKSGTSRFILKTVEDKGNGTYEGIFLFWAEIWKLKFICNYWDLQVNTENVIVNMDFESVYDPQFLVDVDATIDYLDSIASVVTTLTEDVTPDDTITIEDEIITAYVNEGDSVIVVTIDDEGNITETVVSEDAGDIEETLITGEDGEQIVVTRDGEVMGLDEYQNTGGGNNGNIDEYNEARERNDLSEDITVNFTASANQKYGFDQYSEEKSSLQGTYSGLNNGYKPAYKSIASYSTDLVKPSNAGSNILFKDEMGIPAITTGEDVTVRGSVNGSEMALYAYQLVNDTTEKIAGKLNLLSFDEQAQKLYIVPVNGASTPDATSLQNVLNKIYQQAVTKWEVTKLDNLADVIFEEENMTHGGTSAISVYNNDQKTIVNTFEDKVAKLENNAYYLFFVENVTFKDRSIAGYMPLQRQVGFIYDNPNLDIVAHELGHGAFNLYHTFSPDNFIATEHSTENLMDYKGGTDLWKHQWGLVQSPDKMLFAWLQDENEGEYGHTANDEMLVITHLEKFRYGYIFEKEIEININVSLEDNFYARNIYLGDGNKYNFIKVWQDDFPNKVNIIPEKKDPKSTWTMTIKDGIVDVISYMYGGYQNRNFQIACDEDNKSLFASYLFPEKSNTILYKQQFNKVIKDYFINADRSDILDNLNEFPEGIYENLTIDNRIGLLARIAEGSMNSGQFNQASTQRDEDFSEENFALSIINNCPTSESKTFINELSKKAGLLKTLDMRFDDTEYFGADGNQSEFTMSIFNHILAASQTNGSKVKIDINDNSKIYHYVDPLLIQLPVGDRSYVNDQNEIELNLRLTATESGNNNKHDFDEWVIVYFEKDVPEIGYKKGDIKPVPAYFYHYLIRKEINESYRQSISLAIDLASMAFAVGEIKAGVKGIRYAIAVSDIAASVSSIAISSFEEEIINLPGGKDFIHDFRVATGLIALVDIGTLSLEGFFKVADGELARMSKFMDANENALKSVNLEIAENTNKIIGNLPSLVRQIPAHPNYLTFRTIISNPNKTTTLIGRWKDELSRAYTSLSKNDLNIYTLTGKLEHKGGFNMLSIDEWGEIVTKLKSQGIKEGMKAFDDYIWDNFNKPWLESALERGDEIVIWSDPVLSTNLQKYFDVDEAIGKTFFARELEFIKENAIKYGYNYDDGVLTGIFSK